MTRQKKKILFLDDQAHMRKVILYALKEHFDLIVTSKAEEAVSKIKTDDIDLALLDVYLPGDTADGIAVAHMLEKERNDLSIGFLTAYPPESLSACERKRLSHIKNLKFYSVKPQTPKELIEKIKGATNA
ncbi:MAG: response regulator [Deltaproteobacteria bacterium]|nr:response regulator [Deltaproteobacteria bacterium]